MGLIDAAPVLKQGQIGVMNDATGQLMSGWATLGPQVLSIQTQGKPFGTLFDRSVAARQFERIELRSIDFVEVLPALGRRDEGFQFTLWGHARPISLATGTEAERLAWTCLIEDAASQNSAIGELVCSNARLQEQEQLQGTNTALMSAHVQLRTKPDAALWLRRLLCKSWTSAGASVMNELIQSDPRDDVAVEILQSVMQQRLGAKQVHMTLDQVIRPPAS